MSISAKRCTSDQQIYENMFNITIQIKTPMKYCFDSKMAA